MTKQRTRRIAVNEVTGHIEMHTQCIIDIADGVVTGCHPFTEEQPYTEWLGGKAEIKMDDKGCLRVYKNENLIK